MALVEIVMPKMGESVMEGTILGWLKNVGDKIEQDESILEVATDKVDTEIPSTHEGVLKEILVNEGDVVQVGNPIAVIDTDSEVPTDAPSDITTTTEQEEVPEEASSIEASMSTASAYAKLEEPATGRFYSPLVLNIAKEENISMEELALVPGTGQDQRVTKKDILAYVTHKQSNGNGAATTETLTTTVGNGQENKEVKVEEVQPVQETTKQETTLKQEVITKATPVSTPAVSVSGEDEIIEMDRMRKMIAQRMVESVQMAPHVTSFVEADVTNMVYWRRKYKEIMFEQEGETLTFMPMFIEAIAKAIKDYPLINSSVDGDKIIRKKRINIGMAVALPSGNLIVPVIHDADQLNLVGITKKVNDIARRARENKIKPDELQGGTYTISNVGSFGNVLGTPIIMQPQVGILAVGAIRKKPAVIETPYGDTLGIRHMIFLSHSYDHRIVDGALGGMFVRRVADYLEQFDVNRELF
ncbi:MAG: dihydrolipoamide acetyltransferase family protein [Thermonemataceae bacterium]